MFRTWASITFKDAVVCCKSYIYGHIFGFFTASHVHLRTYARMSMRARTYYDCTETKKVFIRTP